MRLELSEKVFSSVSWFDEIDSTNLELSRRLAAGAEDFSAVLAGKQTQGQGRMGRSWLSEAGTSLSLSIAVVGPRGYPGWLSLIAALAVNRMLTKIGIQSGIKWPNDVLVDGKKICGILSSLEPSGTAIVGIGLNLGAQDPQLNATSVAQEGSEISIDQAAAMIGRELRELISEYLKNPELIKNEYAKASITLGQRVRAELPGGREINGIAHEIAPGGELVILTPEPKLLSAGDVWHLRG